MRSWMFQMLMGVALAVLGIVAVPAASAAVSPDVYRGFGPGADLHGTGFYDGIICHNDPVNRYDYLGLDDAPIIYRIDGTVWLIPLDDNGQPKVSVSHGQPVIQLKSRRPGLLTRSGKWSKSMGADVRTLAESGGSMQRAYGELLLQRHFHQDSTGVWQLGPSAAIAAQQEQFSNLMGEIYTKTEPGTALAKVHLTAAATILSGGGYVWYAIGADQTQGLLFDPEQKSLLLKGLDKATDGHGQGAEMLAMAGAIILTRGRGGVGRFATADDFADEVVVRYQRYYDDAYRQVNARIANGSLAPTPGLPTKTFVGGEVDRIARLRMQLWLRREGIAEGAGTHIQLNRWLRDSNLGTGRHRIPDIYIPGANRAIDGTIGHKTLQDLQIIGFQAFGSGSRVTIVRPNALQTLLPNGTQVNGSYSIFP